jgi:hypothetical protein
MWRCCTVCGAKPVSNLAGYTLEIMNPENITVPFGKYKDKTLKQALLTDPQYFHEYLKKQPNFMNAYYFYKWIVEGSIGIFGDKQNSTPEHNGIQMKFLDEWFQQQFVNLLFPLSHVNPQVGLTEKKNKIELVEDESLFGPIHNHNKSFQRINCKPAEFNEKTNQFVYDRKLYQFVDFQAYCDNYEFEGKDRSDCLLTIKLKPVDDRIDNTNSNTNTIGNTNNNTTKHHSNINNGNRDNNNNTAIDKNSPDLIFVPTNPMYSANTVILVHIEIKPSIGDDFMNVFTQCKNRKLLFESIISKEDQYLHQWVLLVGVFRSTNTNIHQLKQLFSKERISVILLEDVELQNNNNKKRKTMPNAL